MPELDLLPNMPAGEVEVRSRGAIGGDERECARTMVAAVVTRHHLAGGARVRLTGGHHPGGPVVVQVNLRVSGAPARIQIAGPDPAAAVSAGAVRLDRQVKRLLTGWEPWPWPDPERRALAIPGSDRITRRKTVPLRPRRACQAASMLAAMDYDVCLFTDADTGEDAVIYRAGPTGLRVARQRGMRPAPASGTPAPTVNSRRTPVLTPAAAATHLAEGWLPFLFFTDEGTGRGGIVYRRYDGGVGLLGPAG
ncbi:sigma 54 modulation/S30EA ribosomal C-terminal domain-containing protein [Dactylosporangium sp. NBC_01737]|uniref:sigma 54 modulation/S30EA ribosomal C-terminal domain-containing protein n=1 Tax=Dactylosporangium sp. NBC_01737 TaxID=2975959 RepID=UPI002E127C3C|nr:sigma 54 modulation/S30EA ribosomal C-terminal domain-containing protein [Dactylosporangium sp. NBC_01737]